MKARAALIRAIVLSSVAALFLVTSLPAQVLLVTNSASGTVSVLNSFTRTVTKTLIVPGPAFPVAAAVNPAATLGAVYSKDAAGTLHRIDFYNLTDASTTTSGLSVTLSGAFSGSTDADITFSTNGACVVATHGGGSAEVSSVSVASRTEVSVVGPAPAAGPRTVTAVPGHPGLILSAFGTSVSSLALNPATCALSHTSNLAIPTSTTIQKIVAHPSGKFALLTDASGLLHAVDISPAGVVSYSESIPIGDTPQSLAITPDGRHVYIYQVGAGEVIMFGLDLLPGNHFDGPTPPIFIPVPTGNDIDGWGLVQTDGNSVFVSRGLDGGTMFVGVISVATNTVVGVITVGMNPRGMAYGGPMCPAHTVHGHLDTNGLDGHDGSSDVHHGEHGHLVSTSECLPAGHQMVANGHHLGLTPESTDGAIPSALTPEADFVAALNQNGLNAPAAPGTIVQLFGSAKGLFLDLADLRPALEFTPPLSGSPLYRTTSLPEVAIGGVKAEVLFSGLAPGLKGVWQINVRVPASVESGKVPVAIAYDGAAVTSVDLAVE